MKGPRRASSSASTTDAAKSSAPSGGVQSLERAFDLLERMADAGGEVGLSELSVSSGLPLPTIHRLMRTLVACGYVRQQANRRYALGPRLIRLGESASRLLGTWARPYLARLVEETGETANMALLDGDEIVYVAQVPSKHSMRMFTEVGRRVLPHSTGVGKALLAEPPADEVRALLARTGMPAATEKTITTPDGFLAALEEVRRPVTRSTTTSRRSASAASPSPSPTPPRPPPSPSPVPRAGSRTWPRRRSCPCSSRSRRNCRRRWPARARGPDRAPPGVTRRRSRRSPAPWPGAGPGVRAVRRPGRAPSGPGSGRAPTPGDGPRPYEPSRGRR